MKDLINQIEKTDNPLRQEQKENSFLSSRKSSIEESQAEENKIP